MPCQVDYRAGLCPLWRARDRQHRSGQPVRRRGVHQCGDLPRLQTVHGWARLMARQCVVERLWRSVKYECVYLKAYDGVSAARADIGRYLDWFNADRAHSSLHGATPQQAYLDLVSKLDEADR